MSLKGRIAVVTGAARRSGRAVSRGPAGDAAYITSLTPGLTGGRYCI